MTVTLLSPNGEKYCLEWKDLLEFSKQICENWISKSEMNRKIFEDYASQYGLFTPYYDFLLHKLQYIQIGFPFFEKVYAIPSINYIKLIPLEENDILEYSYLKGKRGKSEFEIYSGSDKLLDYQKILREYKEGFLFPNGSLISIEQLSNHQNIGYAYLLQKMVEEPSLLEDYMKCKNKLVDIREYFFYRLGCVQTFGTDCRVAIYDVNLITSIQRKMLSKMELDPTIQSSVLEEFQNPFMKEVIRK